MGAVWPSAPAFRTRVRGGSRSGALATAPRVAVLGGAGHLPQHLDQVGQWAEQGQGVDPEVDQLLGPDRVGADEAAGRPGRPQREALGQLGPLATPPPATSAPRRCRPPAAAAGPRRPSSAGRPGRSTRASAAGSTLMATPVTSWTPPGTSATLRASRMAEVAKPAMAPAWAPWPRPACGRRWPPAARPPRRAGASTGRRPRPATACPAPGRRR